MLIQTNKDWKMVEENLKPHSSLKLLIDGYKITARWEFVSDSRLKIILYVNGEFRGEWLIKDSEIRRKFFYKRESYLFPAAERKRLKRVLSKKYYQQFKVDAKYTHYNPYFPSFAALKRHLKQSCEKIEWVN